MGQAKLRGTFEERKELAIKKGRVKVKKKNKVISPLRTQPLDPFLAEVYSIAALAMMSGKRKK